MESVMRRFYTLILWLLAPIVLGRLLWRGRVNREYWRRWGERFGYSSFLIPDSPIWIHAVSVGEVRAAQPLVQELRQRWPGLSLLLTTTTPTGSAQVRALFGDSVYHCYLPYDLPGPVNRFLDRFSPRIALIMETELWPNLYHGCARRGIPVIIINARLSPRSFQGYHRIRPLIRGTLRAVRFIAAQGKGDEQRFQALGATPEQLRVTGSLKFDQSFPAEIIEQGRKLRRQLGHDRPVWIAASTHQGEEQQVLEAFQQLRRNHPDCLLLLVPRHPERFDGVAELCRQQGFTLVRRTGDHACNVETDIFLGDTLGELLLFYAAADVAFVGGSLVPIGGHNMLEPAALGVPVITGPHLFNFSEIAAAMEEVGALCKVESHDQLAETVSRLLSSPERCADMGEQGRQLIEQNRGALQRVLELLRPCLDGY